MKDNPLLNDLITYSKKIGVNKAYIQGGGGNTSIKLDAQWMAIKASGWSLTDLSTTQGICMVDVNKTRTYLNAPDPDETQFNLHIQSLTKPTTKPNQNRPSMETGFHALCKTAVIHTHSVYVNLLTCSVEGPSILKDLFPSAIWIPYDTPGRDLILSIKTHLASQEPNVLFLENHGIIVSHDNMKSAYEQHEQINTNIQEKLNLKDHLFSPTHQTPDIPYMKDHVLFPDQVVYTLSGNTVLATPAATETCAAYQYINDTMKDIGLTSKYIPQKKVLTLMHMESEKYRQAQLKKWSLSNIE